MEPEAQKSPVKIMSLFKSGATQRGSTRSLNHLSEQDAKIVQVSFLKSVFSMASAGDVDGRPAR